MVTLGIPESLITAVIKIKAKEIMLLPLKETKEKTLSERSFKKIAEFAKDVNVVAIGPGLTQNRETLKLARKVVSKINKPMIIDADGLNALAGHLKILKQTGNGERVTGQRILTPHPGEMARLLGINIKQVQAQRKKVAKETANDYNALVVLKGNQTIVAAPGGKTYVNTTGNPGMATAGSGDCLTGMIATFLSQGLEPFKAAKFAVYLHGLAGDLAAKEKTEISLIASDIIAKIPEAIKQCS